MALSPGAFCPPTDACRSQPSFGGLMAEILDIPAQRIVMPDGMFLSARARRPATGAVVPVIIEIIPFQKRDGTAARDEALHPCMAARGYGSLRVDLRGSGDSAGILADEYTPRDSPLPVRLSLGPPVRPWCDGAFGMMGKSWGAFNAPPVAALQPPALQAVIAVCGTNDRFADDFHFKGGCLLAESFGSALVMVSYSSRPADSPRLATDCLAAVLGAAAGGEFLTWPPLGQPDRRATPIGSTVRSVRFGRG